MFYPQSPKILSAIKKSRRIIINIHPHPDLDAVGSALAMGHALKKMGKKDWQIICPEKIRENFSFLKGFEKVKTVDFLTFGFSQFDLLLILDASSYDRVTGDKKIFLPKIPKIVIDHHKTNELDGDIRLVDLKASATAEIIYRLFNDWQMDIPKEAATAIFSGIVGDTVFFRYTADSRSTFKIAADLIDKGADKNLLMEKFYNNYQVSFLKLLGKFLEKIEFDKKRKFIWSAIAYEEYKKLGRPVSSQSLVADMFFQSVKDADFGMSMLEREPGKLSVSFRSKPHFDVSILAKRLGGGGHKNAAGATLYGSFNEVVKKILRVAGHN